MVSLLGLRAEASCVELQPRLAKAADAFAQEFEVFDETLRATGAPERVIAIVHHFEEGFTDFQDSITRASCREAIGEFQHFHEDIQLTYRELTRYPQYFYGTAKVLPAWNHFLPEFVRFQNILYAGGW